MNADTQSMSMNWEKCVSDLRIQKGTFADVQTPEQSV
jgi:hypothetical protein